MGVAAGQARKVDCIDERVCGEPLRDQLGTSLLSLNAHRQRLQPSVQQVAGEGMQDATGDRSYLPNPRRPLRASGDDPG